MNGFRFNQPFNAPGFVTLYELDDPVPVSMPAERQAHIIYTQARLVECNQEVSLIPGMGSIRELCGLTMQEIVEQADADKALFRAQTQYNNLKVFVERAYQFEAQPSYWSLDGERKQFRSAYYGFVSEDKLHRVLVYSREDALTQYEHLLIDNLSAALAADSVSDFFSVFCQRLVESLGATYALLAETLSVDDGLIRVLSLNHCTLGKQLTDNQSLSVENSLLANVLLGEEVICAHNAQASLPANEPFNDIACQSYVAIPVVSTSQQPLGVLMVLFEQSIDEFDWLESLLRLLGIRVAIELERTQILEKERSRERQQRVFIDNSANGMFVMDIEPSIVLDDTLQRQVQQLAENARFRDANDAFAKMLGLVSRVDVIGQSLLTKNIMYDFATVARDFINNAYSFQDYLVRIIVKREEFWFSFSASAVIEDNHLTQVLGLMMDVSDRVRHSQLMEYQARHDSLTDLPNRSYFMEQANKLRQMNQPGCRHALLLLDLDGFKEINDTLGHETGDYLLKQVGPRMKALLPTTNTLLARLGGDEFAVFIDAYDDIQVIKELADNLLAAIRSPFIVNELELLISSSIGISLYPENAETISSLLRCADVAMYQAKKSSLDYCFYSIEQDHFTVSRLSLMMDIRQCIANDELRLFYQPIINLGSQQPVGFEALIRWQHPRHGMLPPGDFIPLIELSDMIVPVTWWVVETAIKQLAKWRERDWHYQISVNVSARNLIDEGFVRFVAGCLRRYSVAGRYLELEITESTLMADPEKARRLLLSMAGLGVTIAIDDYGTGYSSLAYLKSLPIHTLKIDRTFIAQMMLDDQDRIIVNSTIQLAHNLGMDVTAEGIEDPSLIDELLDMGCDKGQGYYFCKPAAIDVIEDWLRTPNTVASG